MRSPAHVLPALVLAALAGCVSVPERQHALVLEAGGGVARTRIACADQPAAPLAGGGALDPRAIRLATWNLHKEADPGWESDLARLGRESDVLLIQEAGVSAALRSVLEGDGFSWMLSSAFEYQGEEYGVLTATRVSPRAACTLRAYEPLTRIPKAVLVTRYALAGRDDALAIANLHAINFTLGTLEYRAQLEAIAEVLSAHDGPLIVAGDFNTWNDGRDAAVRDLAETLSLAPVVFPVDDRTRFLGRVFDRVYARGIEILAADAWRVSSSDHNPLLVRLRVR